MQHAKTHPWTVTVKTDKDTGKTTIKPKYHEVPLVGNLQALFDERKTLVQAVKAIETKMEAEATALSTTATVPHDGHDRPMVPEGFTPIYGYNFGKFSLAAIPVEAKIERKAKAPAAKWGTPVSADKPKGKGK
jgi:hypothetical protein